MDAKAAAAKDTTAVGSTAAVSVGAAETTNEAAEAATITQPAERGTGARFSTGLARKGQRAAGSCVQTPRRQAGAGAESPAFRRESVALVMLVAGRCRCQRARSARR